MYQNVLDFWFDELKPAQWWQKSKALDEDIARRFGRYPHRNVILGRESTPDEQAFLKQPGSGF